MLYPACSHPLQLPEESDKHRLYLTLYPACCHPLQLPLRDWECPAQVIFDAIPCLLPPPPAARKRVAITGYIWCYTLLVATPSSCPLESAQHRLYLMLYPACCHPLQLPLREWPSQVIFDAIHYLLPPPPAARKRVAITGYIWYYTLLVATPSSCP